MQMQPQETVKEIEMTVAIILLIVFSVSIPFNLLVFRVHCRFERQTIYRFLIKTLMMTDLGICLTSIVWLSFTVHGTTPGHESCFYKASEVVLKVIEGQALSSAGAIAAIAADRYEAICRPHHRRYLSLAKARLVALVVGASTLLWIGVNIYGTLTIDSWNSIACFVNAGVIIIALIWVVGAYIRICIQLQHRARVRADLRNCPCRVWMAGRRQAQPPPSILKVTGSSHLEQDAVGTGNACSISGRVTIMTSHTTATPISHDLASDAPLTDISSTQPRQEPVFKTHMEAPGPSTTDNPTANASTTNNTNPKCPSARPRPRCHCSEDGHTAAKVSAMLVLTTVVHVISWIPSLAYSVVSVSHVAYNSTLHLVLWALDHLCYMNVALYPFLYGLSNGEFRREFRETIRRDFRI